MSKTTYWPTYTLLAVLVIMGGGFAYAVHLNNERQVADEIAFKNKTLVKDLAVVSSNDSTNVSETGVGEEITEINSEANWQKIYPKTKTLQIAEVPVQASVAKTWAERIQGLSDTPFLPENVVKLFVFDSNGLHSIWMKDMNYAIDIIWVDEANKVIDIKRNATPESYPEAFTPKTEARYVIETATGFVDKNDINIGDTVTQE